MTAEEITVQTLRTHLCTHHSMGLYDLLAGSGGPCPNHDLDADELTAMHEKAHEVEAYKSSTDADTTHQLRETLARLDGILSQFIPDLVQARRVIREALDG
jgi:hypothetical protein